MEQNDQQVNEIHKLIDEGKLDEAKIKLKELVSPELSSAEKGEVLAQTAFVYMSLMTEINNRYVEIMQQRLSQLEEINGIKSEVDKKIDMADVRETIMNS